MLRPSLFLSIYFSLKCIKCTNVGAFQAVRDKEKDPAFLVETDSDTRSSYRDEIFKILVQTRRKLVLTRIDNIVLAILEVTKKNQGKMKN